MPHMKSKKKVDGSYTFSDYLIGILLFVITGIIPLIVRGINGPLAPELFNYYNAEFKDDAFAYYKSWMVMLSALVIVFYVASDLVTNSEFRKHFDFKSLIKNPPVIAALVYILFVIISDIFSQYPHLALQGTAERYEGLWVQLAYMVIFFTALYYPRRPLPVNFILWGLICSSVVMGLIGLSQLIRHDFFVTSLGSIIVTGRPGATSPVFTMAYGTLYNPNTFGLFTAMIAPLLWIVGYAHPNRIMKALLWLGGALMMTGIIASQSLGGFMGMAAAVVILVITGLSNRVYHKKGLPKPVYIPLSIVLALVLVSYAAVAPVRNNVNNLITKLTNTIRNEQREFPEYQMEGNSLVISYNQELLRVAYDNHNQDTPFTVTDNSGQPIQADSRTEDGDRILWIYQTPLLGKITLVQSSQYFMFNDIYLAAADGNNIALVSRTGEVIWPHEDIPAMGFKGRETWATNRGYIWSRSIPLLLKHLVLGSGSDSYILEFPQNEMFAKKNYYNQPYITVDKAHNLYLQTGITTGGVSMLALLFILAHYMIGTFLSLVKSGDEDRYSYSLRLGLLVSVGAFAVSSLSTDSTVGTTPVFWVILGLGYAMNALAVKRS